MVDAVLSLHTNPNTCGVAKFDIALAKRLNVPHSAFTDPKRFRCPLVSIKAGEWPLWWMDVPAHLNSYQLFFHDSPRVTGERRSSEVVTRAWRVYAGNRDVAEDLREVRPDVVQAFCPSTLGGSTHRGAYRVLVFGMAHKLNLPRFRALKQELDIAHPDYTIELSTAVHEGNPWDTALADSVYAMRGIFGDKLRVLGFLGDDALAKELREVDAVACYFQPALRANNTSYWAAVEAGKTIFTNRDEYSPKEGDPPVTWEALVSLIQGAA